MHQDNIGGHSVQPRSECGIAPKRLDFAVYLQKDFLSEVFRV